MPLFKTIPEFRKYIPVDENLYFETIKPLIIEAEQSFITALLGAAFYNTIATDYTNNTNAEGVSTGMNADNLILLPYIQRSLAYYAAYLSINHIGVRIGEVGIQEQMGNNSRPASRWKVRDLQIHYITQADRFADTLLTYLEQNAGPAKYNDWYSNANANTAMEGFIVYSTQIFSRHHDISESRRVFLRLRKWIKQVEQGDIKRILCVDQYSALVTQIKTGSLTANNKKLIEVLEPFICKKALWLAIPSLPIQLTDEGLNIISSNDGVVQKASASKEDIKNLMCSLKDGEYGFDSLKKSIDQFIIDNIDDYPLIEGSACWTSKDTTPPKYQPDNDSCNKHFSV